jgi:hypothetical protein
MALTVDVNMPPLNATFKQQIDDVTFRQNGCWRLPEATFAQCITRIILILLVPIANKILEPF